MSANIFYFTATWLNAALIPAATDSVLPTDQKCMKNNRGCSVAFMARLNNGDAGPMAAELRVSKTNE